MLERDNYNLTGSLCLNEIIRTRKIYMFVRDSQNQTGYLGLYEIILTRQDNYVCTRKLELDGILMLERDNYNWTGYL